MPTVAVSSTYARVTPPVIVTLTAPETAVNPESAPAVLDTSRSSYDNAVTEAPCSSTLIGDPSTGLRSDRTAVLPVLPRARTTAPAPRYASVTSAEKTTEMEAPIPLVAPFACEPAFVV